MEQTQNNINNSHVLDIMKELSDIHTNLAINSNETQNIKATVNEIKVDVKAFKNDFISRLEFNEAIAILKEEINPLKKLLFGLLITVGITVLASLLKLVVL